MSGESVRPRWPYQALFVKADHSRELVAELFVGERRWWKVSERTNADLATMHPPGLAPPLSGTSLVARDRRPSLVATSRVDCSGFREAGCPLGLLQREATQPQRQCKPIDCTGCGSAWPAGLPGSGMASQLHGSRAGVRPGGPFSRLCLGAKRDSFASSASWMTRGSAAHRRGCRRSCTAQMAAL